MDKGNKDTDELTAVRDAFMDMFGSTTELSTRFTGRRDSESNGINIRVEPTVVVINNQAESKETTHNNPSMKEVGELLLGAATTLLKFLK